MDAVHQTMIRIALVSAVNAHSVTMHGTHSYIEDAETDKDGD